MSRHTARDNSLPLLLGGSDAGEEGIYSFMIVILNDQNSRYSVEYSRGSHLPNPDGQNLFKVSKITLEQRSLNVV